MSDPEVINKYSTFACYYLRCNYMQRVLRYTLISQAWLEKSWTFYSLDKNIRLNNDRIPHLTHLFSFTLMNRHRIINNKSLPGER